MTNGNLPVNSVLLIDDDELVNYLNEIIIRKSGRVNKVTAVLSANQGIASLEESYNTKNWPNIILVDINMPGLDGWGFMEQFNSKFESVTPKPLICMLSSSLDPRDETRAKQLNSIKYFIPKPITYESLEQIYKTYNKDFQD